jgi:hypothetical protein
MIFFLLEELREHENKLHSYTRMMKQTFEHFLQLVGPAIQKQDEYFPSSSCWSHW